MNPRSEFDVATPDILPSTHRVSDFFDHGRWRPAVHYLLADHTSSLLRASLISHWTVFRASLKPDRSQNA